MREQFGPAIAYQSRPLVSRKGHECYALGKLETQKWELLNKHEPRRGVSLTYTGGQRCGAKRRKLTYHFICADEHHGLQGPFEVNEYSEPRVKRATVLITSELPTNRRDLRPRCCAHSHAREVDVCHYSVIWPTHHACPQARGLGFGTFLMFLFLVGGMAMIAMMPGLRKKALQLVAFFSDAVKSASVGWPSQRGGRSMNNTFGSGSNPFAKSEKSKARTASGPSTSAKPNNDDDVDKKIDDFDELFPMQTA